MAQVIWNNDIDVYNPKVMPVLVARTICKYLCVPDLVAFALVLRNTYKTANDAGLWIDKLKLMGVWHHGLSDEEPDIKSLENPLTCLSHISSKGAKFQVLKVHKALYPYYSDLQYNKPYDQLKLFQDFQTPEDQALILGNLLKYNRIDFNQDTCDVSRDKLNSILEIFENALLRELEIHYDIQDYVKTSQFVTILVQLQNHQTLIDFFLQKIVFDNEESKFFSLEAFDSEAFFTESDGHYTLDFTYFGDFINNLSQTFNEQARVIDLIFPQSIPMMYKVSEELVSNQLVEFIMLIVDTSKTHNLYLQTVPYLYDRLSTDFIQKLNPSANIGESYHRLLLELIDMLYESFVTEYIRDEVTSFKSYCNDNIRTWLNQISKREAETTESIWKHVKVETKNDFLTSFKKVFTISLNKSEEETETSTENYSEMQAKAKILSENIKSLNKSFSPELALEILNEAKISLGRLLKFKEYSIAASRSEIYSSIQEVFIAAIDALGNEHLRPGFNKALEYLKTYNPKEMNYIGEKQSLIEPLVLFFDLINMADLIIQMIDIFYKEEMINLKAVILENSILNPSLQNKKKLEGLVDTYVADGLNVGIDLLMAEIDSVYKTTLRDTDYNPPPDAKMMFDGPTEAARKAVLILDDNIDLLVGNADKSIVEVFQQEIAERFFQTIVKVLKKSTILETGAINLISDLNLYYDFILNHIRTNKRLVVPLFQGLKNLGSIYLIAGSDLKSIGKLVSDLSKFNGIFSQEEIYEFVQRRLDWPIIKRDVEKVMYGLGLGDCAIV